MAIINYNKDNFTVTRIVKLTSGIVVFYNGTDAQFSAKESDIVQIDDNFSNIVVSRSGDKLRQFGINALTQIVTPTNSLSLTALSDVVNSSGVKGVQDKIIEVYEWLVAYVFKACCCDDGGGVPIYQTNTYAGWDVIRLANALPAGSWIEVTAIPSQPDTTMVLFCTSSNEIGLGGKGTFLNADWQAVGDYTGVVGVTGIAFGTQLFQWYAGIEATAVNGDVVIWDCLHYQVTDDAAFAGTDPAATPLAYTLLPKATANVGYVQEVDEIEFDFPNDWLQYRADKRGNRLLYTSFDEAGFGFTALNLFQWGNDAWIYNVVFGGWIDQLNFAGTIDGNILEKYGVIESNTGVGGSITANQIGSYCSISNNDLDAAYISGNVLYGNTGIAQLILTTGEVFGFNILSSGGGGYPTTGTNQRYSAVIGNNTFESSYDITGLTTLNVNLTKETGILILTSSNATETINLITNALTTIPLTLRPAAGLTLTVTFTAVGSLAANGEIVGPTANIVLVGDNGDQLTLQAATIGGFDVTKQIDANTSI